MENFYGQCACGKVKYQFSTDKLIAYQCHCSICRKVTGTAYTTTLMAPSQDFKWLSGEDAVSLHAESNGYKSSFCSNCGSPVPNRFRDYPLYSVPVGSINGTPEIEVVAQLYMASRGMWDKVTLQGEQFAEMPGLDEMLRCLHVQP